MSQQSTKPRDLSLTSQHLPSVTPGNYVLHVEQTVSVPDSITGSTEKKRFQKTRRFTVAGDRYRIEPQFIRSAFPPKGSLGDHSNTLPHIMFTRTTLPWERLPQVPSVRPQTEPEGHDRLPWLALLLFDEDDPQPSVHRTTIGELQKAARAPQNGTPLFSMPGFEMEFGKPAETEIQVLDVSRNLLRRICPTWIGTETPLPWHALYYTAHVRQIKIDKDTVESELSCITGTRLPRPGKQSVVHLVSIEGRFDEQGFIDMRGDGDAQVRFISLHSWSFHCKSRTESFKGLLEKIDCAPSHLHLPATMFQGKGQQFETALAEGYVPLEHRLRDGNRVASLYRGPLIPGLGKESAEVPVVENADALLRHHPSGLLDVSLSAAWELGRMLTIKRRSVARALFAWKRQHIRAVRNAKWSLTHLPYRALEGAPELPESVASWFHDLSRLHHIPLSYLLPHHALLPVESLRSVSVDARWVEALLAGAFSVGRLTRSDIAPEASMRGHVSAVAGHVTGILLRSDAVSGWPDLQVSAKGLPKGHDAPGDTQPLTRFRHSLLSDHILLALFEGRFETVDIAQKPEVLHFGVDRPEDVKEGFDGYSKKHRDPSGQLRDGTDFSMGDYGNADSRVLSFGALAQKFRDPAAQSPITSGEFALQMVVGVESVRFVQPLPEGSDSGAAQGAVD